MNQITKQNIPKSYNKSMRYKSFNVWDWNLRKALGNKVETTYKKFIATWKSPYQIYDITIGDSYQIESHGRREELSQNGEQLKTYYM